MVLTRKKLRVAATQREVDDEAARVLKNDAFAVSLPWAMYVPAAPKLNTRARCTPRELPRMFVDVSRQ
jgi:hypothetical protein